MAAVAPAQLGGRLENNELAIDGSDVDAEGEEDVEMEYDAAATEVMVPNATIEKAHDRNEEGDEENGSEEEGQEEGQSESSDGEGEEDEDVEGEDEDDDEVVGAVKLPAGENLDSDVESSDDSESGEEEARTRKKRDNSGSDASGESDSEAESEAVEEWEDASAGEGETDVAARNNCIFCKQDEEHDPSEEFEEYLSCAVCGDNSHRQCARSADSLALDDQAEEWRCPQCVTNSLAPGTDQSPMTRRLSSSSRLNRELLPATRGATKPGSHSIFNTLIVDGDPMDGSRALRKRKSSSEAREQSTASSKRQKRSSNEAPAHSASQASSVVGDNESKHEANVDETSRTRDARSIEKGKSGADESAARPARPRRQKPEATRVRPLIRESQRLILAIRVDTTKIKERPPKKSRRTTVTSSGHARFGAAPTTMHYSAPFYSLQDREVDESKIKPYGGILSEAEADTSKTFPATADRARFEEARQKAEEEWKLKTAASEAENETKGRASQKISGPPSKIKCINFGGYEIDTWYAAPYPEEYSRNRVLYICEFCLKYMPSDYVAWRHKLKCPAKHPPGDEIYRDKSVSIFEVDGRKNPVYCQNLCLLAKLFLGSKTLYYDVEPFLFYIMTEYDDLGYHFVGYFSKEKRPSSMNNVSCILTLPIHQRKGYGNLLIDFSYLLTRKEQKTGSPEKPLSDMGLVSYRNYWRLVLAYTLVHKTEQLSILKISDLTGMTADDIIAGLEALRALVRDPLTKTYALRLDRTFLKETIDRWEAKKYVSLNKDALIWTPYIMGHFNLTNYDRGAISTVAPREDEEDQDAVPEEGVQQAAASANAASAIAASKVNGTAESSNTITLDTNIDPALTLAPPKSASMPASPLKINGIHLSTPVQAPSPVPPTRYEIYPPIPGTIARRRTTKGGGRRNNQYTTPGALSIRRDRYANGTSSPRVNGISPRHITTPTTRKTRSALGKEIDSSKIELAPRDADIDEDKGKGKADDQPDAEDANGEVSSESDSEGDEDEEVDAKARPQPNNHADSDADGHDDDEDDAEAEADADVEAEPEPDADADAEDGEDDGDFEPDGDNDAEGEEEDEEADVDAEAAAEDDSEDADGSDEDAEGEEDDDAEAPGEPDAEGSEDAEGESDPGDDVAMVDA